MNRESANICKDGGVFCKIEYPHSHAGPTVDDLVEPAKWPDRVYWEPPQRFNGRNPYRLFQFGWFASHSGFQLPWKLELAQAGWEDLAAERPSHLVQHRICGHRPQAGCDQVANTG